MMLLLAALKGIRTTRCFRLWVAAFEQMRACLLVCHHRLRRHELAQCKQTMQQHSSTAIPVIL